MKTEVYILLQRIAELQSAGTASVPAGVFSSIRKHEGFSLERVDNNVFFTALILFTLSSCTALMTKEEKELYEQIRAKALPSFSLYTSNPEGIRLYNFWQKKTQAHFPGGHLLHSFNYFKLPDDADDTALVWLAGGYTSDEMIQLKAKIIEHAAYSKRKPYHVPSAYKELKLYSSWFGKNMPIEIDACVITNVLYLFLESNQPLNAWDEDNLIFIKKVIHSADYLHKPFRVSPNYAHPVIIFYHLVRLVTRFPEYFSTEKEILLQHAEILKQSVHAALYQCVLDTSEIRLGNKEVKVTLLEKSYIQEPWFRAGMMSTWENSLSHWLAPSSLFHLTFSCEAYSYALNAECFLLKR